MTYAKFPPGLTRDNTTANLGAVVIFAVIDTICRLQNLHIDLED